MQASPAWVQGYSLGSLVSMQASPAWVQGYSLGSLVSMQASPAWVQGYSLGSLVSMQASPFLCSLQYRKVGIRTGAYLEISSANTCSRGVLIFMGCLLTGCVLGCLLSQFYSTKARRGLASIVLADRPPYRKVPLALPVNK